MQGDLSILKLASAMARHAGAGHAAVGRNIARADIPGASAQYIEPFSSFLANRKSSTGPDYVTSDGPISIEQEMVEMTRSAGRHEAAVTIWSKAVDLMRLAGQSPR